MTESSVYDITWVDMARAGLEPDLVNLKPNDLGGHDYVWESGETRIAFGPAVDMEDGGTNGWALCLYVLRDETWEDVSQDWQDDPAEVLARVVQWSKG